MRRSGAFVMALAPLWGSMASQDASSLVLISSVPPQS